MIRSPLSRLASCAVQLRLSFIFVYPLLFFPLDPSCQPGSNHVQLDPNRTPPLRDKVASHPSLRPSPPLSLECGQDPARIPGRRLGPPPSPDSRSPSRSSHVNRYLGIRSWDSPVTNPANRPQTLESSGRSSTKARACKTSDASRSRSEC